MLYQFLTNKEHLESCGLLSKAMDARLCDTLKSITKTNQISTLSAITGLTWAVWVSTQGTTV